MMEISAMVPGEMVSDTDRVSFSMQDNQIDTVVYYKNGERDIYVAEYSDGKLHGNSTFH